MNRHNLAGLLCDCFSIIGRSLSQFGDRYGLGFVTSLASRLTVSGLGAISLRSFSLLFQGILRKKPKPVSTAVPPSSSPLRTFSQRHFSPGETSLVARSKEKRLYLQARKTVNLDVISTQNLP